MNDERMLAHLAAYPCFTWSMLQRFALLNDSQARAMVARWQTEGRIRALVATPGCYAVVAREVAA